MPALGMPDGVPDVGYTGDDLEALVEGMLSQHRLVQNAPTGMNTEGATNLFETL